MAKWIWVVGIIGVGLLAYIWIKSRKPASASTSTSTFGNQNLLSQGRNPYTGALTWNTIPLNNSVLQSGQQVYIQPGSGSITTTKPARGGIYAD